jgi:hypothetical protein
MIADFFCCATVSENTRMIYNLKMLFVLIVELYSSN